MEAVYTAQAVTEGQVLLGASTWAFPTTSQGQYHLEAGTALIVHVTDVLGKQYNAGDPGYGMRKLAERGPNALTRIKTTDAITIESILAESKAAARRIASDAIPAITNRTDAQDEADRRNMNNQAVIGAKEGVIKAITAHVGSDITDPILRKADGSNVLKNIDDVAIWDIFQAVIAAADRPATKTVLEKVIALVGFRFNFQRKVAANVEQLRINAAKLTSYGIVIDETQIALCILSNIEEAIKHEYGREFRPAMQTVRREFNYNHVHDATSVARILTEMAAADGVRELRDAPAPTGDSYRSHGDANAVNESVSILRDLLEETAISTDYESAYGTMTDDSESSGEERRAAREKRKKTKAKREKEREKKDRGRSKSRDRRGRGDEPREKNKCPHCKVYKRRNAHPKVPEEKCQWNKAFKGYRPAYVCQEMETAYVPRHRFSAALGGPPDDSDSD